MALPIKTFWLMSSNVERIMAQEDIRSMSVAIVSQSSEGSQSFREQLVIEAGTIVKLEEGAKEIDVMPHAPRDEGGFGSLKMMASQSIGQ